MDAPRANRLAGEKSPYLLQHAHNPVGWYPWGEEALARARELDRPIFLSIGYSTCHWCHVMELESFEDPAIAALLDEHFVPIKVDREERPDLDEIYMAAVQAMTGQGGWPLSAWLTPELRPFYGGTYFPPDDRYGRPGFPRVLQSLATSWTTRREEIEAMARRAGEALAGMGRLEPADAAPGAPALDLAHERLGELHDHRHGGWGGAPKFPRADFGELCLRRWARTGEAGALDAAERTMERMVHGGLFDQLGGGFHRYSTDAEWLAPHFEKMLYDNAQLLLHLSQLVQATGREDFARAARLTGQYLLREMQHPEGGFYSAQDADSEGVEGKFFVWSRDEVGELLGEELAGPFALAYDITPEGNWEGHNIPRRVLDDAEVAARSGLDPDEVATKLEAARVQLLEHREQRVHPGRDDKVLTGWNGLAIAALARSGVVLDEPAWVDAAQRSAGFCLGPLRPGGKLKRRWREGEAAIDAFAEDFAFLVAGLLELYQACLEPRWLVAARELHGEMERHFLDPADGAFHSTREGQADLLVRVKAGYDGSVPTANSVAAQNLAALHDLTGEPGYREALDRLLAAFGATLGERPLGLASMLLALDAAAHGGVQLVLAAPGEQVLPAAEGLRDAARRAGYTPDLRISGRPAAAPGEAEAAAPALAGKEPVGGAPTAHVCREFACRRPVAEPAEMLGQLSPARREA